MSFQDYVQELETESKFGKPKLQYIVGLAAIIIFIVVFVGMRYFGSDTQSFSVEKSDTSSAAASSSDEESASIFVHVSGAVNNPGLVELKKDDRVQSAIDAAGGASEDANLDSINLAKKVEDGEQIVVASKNETSASDTGTSSSSADASSLTQATGENGKVNINTADSTQLQTISGIGPSKAQKIIDYRNTNGRFKSVEDLTNVSGIGEKTLASIKDQITV